MLTPWAPSPTLLTAFLTTTHLTVHVLPGRHQAAPVTTPEDHEESLRLLGVVKVAQVPGRQGTSTEGLAGISGEQDLVKPKAFVSLLSFQYK